MTDKNLMELADEIESMFCVCLAVYKKLGKTDPQCQAHDIADHIRYRAQKKDNNITKEQILKYLSVYPDILLDRSSGKSRYSCNGGGTWHDTLESALTEAIKDEDLLDKYLLKLEGA